MYVYIYTSIDAYTYITSCMRNHHILSSICILVEYSYVNTAIASMCEYSNHHQYTFFHRYEHTSQNPRVPRALSLLQKTSEQCKYRQFNKFAGKYARKLKKRKNNSTIQKQSFINQS